MGLIRLDVLGMSRKVTRLLVDVKKSKTADFIAVGAVGS
jgi:hypothetical protein